MQTLFSGGPIDTAHQDDVVQLVPCHRIINLPNFIRPAQAMMEGARGTSTRGCARTQEHAHGTSQNHNLPLTPLIDREVVRTNARQESAERKEWCTQYVFHISGNLSTGRPSPATLIHNPSLRKVAFLCFWAKLKARRLSFPTTTHHY
jgi:hypothetical protein